MIPRRHELRIPRSAATLVVLALGTMTCITHAQEQPAPSQPVQAQPAPSPAPQGPPEQAATDVAAAAEHLTAENAALANEITPELESSIQRGFEALASMQGEDGSWGGPRFDRHVGITALACLAFMADGNVPGRGRYARQVERGLEFVLANCTETGLIAADTGHGPMYGHGFAALFLGEVYGMTGGGPNTPQGSRLYEALVKACRLIVETQNDEGGWRYNPVPYDADVSVTICQIMALRSARNAGLEIPKATIDRAVEYVKACQNPDGGFRYQMTQGGSAWPRSAAGVASLYYAGIYQDEAVDRGLVYLLENALPQQTQGGSHYFYGHYYAVQAMYLAGGANWARWWPEIRRELIENQEPTLGVWDDQYAGSAYGTAMALIIMQMPKRYLPIFQK